MMNRDRATYSTRKKESEIHRLVEGNRKNPNIENEIAFNHCAQRALWFKFILNTKYILSALYMRGKMKFCSVFFYAYFFFQTKENCVHKNMTNFHQKINNARWNTMKMWAKELLFSCFLYIYNFFVVFQLVCCVSKTYLKFIWELTACIITYNDQCRKVSISLCVLHLVFIAFYNIQDAVKNWRSRKTCELYIFRSGFFFLSYKLFASLNHRNAWRKPNGFFFVSSSFFRRSSAKTNGGTHENANRFVRMWQMHQCKSSW